MVFVVVVKAWLLSGKTVKLNNKDIIIITDVQSGARRFGES